MRIPQRTEAVLIMIESPKESPSSMNLCGWKTYIVTWKMYGKGAENVREISISLLAVSCKGEWPLYIIIFWKSVDPPDLGADLIKEPLFLKKRSSFHSNWNRERVRVRVMVMVCYLLGNGQQIPNQLVAKSKVGVGLQILLIVYSKGPQHRLKHTGTVTFDLQHKFGI